MSDLSSAMSGPPFSREEITQDEVRKHDRRFQKIERRLQMSGANVSNSYTIIGMTPPSLAMDYTFTASGGTVTITPNGSDNAFTYSVDLSVFVPGVLPSDTPLTLDYSGFTTDKNYSVFLGAATPLYELSAVAWTNVTTPGPAALAIQNGVPVLASDKNKRYMGMFYFPSSGDPVVTVPGGDVNWGGAVDGATVGGLMYAVDITGKVILCSANLVWDNANQLLYIGGTVRGLAELIIYGADAAADSDEDGKGGYLVGGNGDGIGGGGEGLVVGGNGGETGDGGGSGASGGDGGSTSGSGGSASLRGGPAPTDGNGGDCNITPGTGAGSGVDGVVKIGLYSSDYVQITRAGAMSFEGDAKIDDDVEITGSISVGVPTGYAEMYMYDNVTACAIDTANVYHAIYNTFGNNDGTLAPLQDATHFTYKAGVGYSISAFADYNAPTSTQTKVTCGAHALLAGEPVTITGTTNYNGTYLVLAAGLSATEFVITKVYAGNDATGSVRRPATLKCLVDGSYQASFNFSGTCANTNDVFKWELNKDVTALDNIVARSIWTSGANNYRSVAATGLVSLTAGQYVWASVKNYGGTGDLTFNSGNVTLRILK